MVTRRKSFTILSQVLASIPSRSNRLSVATGGEPRLPATVFRVNAMSPPELVSPPEHYQQIIDKKKEDLAGRDMEFEESEVDSG